MVPREVRNMLGVFPTLIAGIIFAITSVIMAIILGLALVHGAYSGAMGNLKDSPRFRLREFSHRLRTSLLNDAGTRPGVLIGVWLFALPFVALGGYWVGTH